MRRITPNCLVLRPRGDDHGQLEGMVIPFRPSPYLCSNHGIKTERRFAAYSAAVRCIADTASVVISSREVNLNYRDGG